MVRKNYFEILDELGFKPRQEFENLLLLLKQKNFYNGYYSYSLFDTASDNFLRYKNRLTFIEFEAFLKYFWQNAENTTERLFLTAEVLNDIFKELLDRFSSEQRDYIENAILHNIRKFLDLANHEMIMLDDGREIIVEKNVYASQVSQIISETNIHEAIKVLEYNHFANKGNVERKREILISLAKYLEPLRNELNFSEELKEVLKVNNGKISAVDKLFEMYNQFGLRHNNSKQYHNSMTEEECERWYDDIYTSTLFVVLSLNEAQILSRLNLLKST
ncbi:TPA: hypothetical protein ACHV9L_001151 [Streptococcus suis]|uniref:hypothetical protein n=1 Tax=Streptococcus suis TaxID=1307 RepID=UPI0019319E19|nr:hypothetical protein [Streptococcus suis]MBM0194873.1 hypothetical protein [Streptococcus suis]MBM7315875.1 hypothetical protein [Streptococcus suis]HEM6184783.1 hypothetical protein [Streptococcus suis]